MYIFWRTAGFIFWRLFLICRNFFWKEAKGVKQKVRGWEISYEIRSVLFVIRNCVFFVVMETFLYKNKKLFKQHFIYFSNYYENKSNLLYKITFPVKIN